MQFKVKRTLAYIALAGLLVLSWQLLSHLMTNPATAQDPKATE